MLRRNLVWAWILPFLSYPVPVHAGGEPEVHTQMLVALPADLAQSVTMGVVILACILCGVLSLGIWLGRRTVQPTGPSSHDVHKLDQMFEVLSRWSHGVAREVADFKSLVDQALVEQKSVDLPGESKSVATLDDSALARLEQLRLANQQLQERLTEAQDALQLSADEAAAYLAEARTDPLTGLPNRRVFDEEFGTCLLNWRRQGTPLSILLIDIDHFKKINDQFGHLTGDRVLKEVAQNLRDAVRPGDLIARFGGEEFAVLMPDTSAGRAQQTAERIRQAASQSRIESNGQSITVTASGGVAQALPQEDPTAILHRADLALYASKRAGRNRAHWHDGQRVMPIATIGPVLESPFQRGALTASPEFEDLRRNLRQRLLHVVEQDTPATTNG